MNTPVSFELAKLLKEKKFNQPQFKYYDNGGTLCHSVCVVYNSGLVLAPTIAEVVMWLYERHSLHIEILLEEDAPWSKFYYRTMKVGQYFALNIMIIGALYLIQLLSHNGIYKDSPTEAYEAGIEHILNNLI